MSALPLRTEGPTAFGGLAPARSGDARFLHWRRAVGELLVARLGILLDQVARLTLVDAYELGETPAEFVAGCLLDPSGWTSDEGAAGLGGHEPSWPPPG